MKADLSVCKFNILEYDVINCVALCFVSKKGYVLRVQAVQAPKRVQNYDRDAKERSERPFLRIPAAGHKTSGENNGQSGNIHPAREDHNHRSQRPYPFIPEAQNVPKGKVSVFKADSLTGQRALAYNPVGPDGIQQARPKYVLSTGVIQVPSHNYHAKSKFSDNRKALIYTEGNTVKQLQKVSNPINKKTGVISSNSTEKINKRTFFQTWRPRGFSSGLTLEARGYAHVRYLKPGFDKTPDKSGLAVPASNERQQNFGYNSRGKPPVIWLPPQPNGVQNHVQGKFKPFQKVSNDEPPLHNNPEGESAPTEARIEITISIPDLVVPEELSTRSVSHMQAEGLDTQLVYTTSSPESKVQQTWNFQTK